MKALEGKKTHLAALGLVLAGVLILAGKLSVEDAVGLVVVLNGGGLAALRAGVKKGAEKVTAPSAQ